MTRSYFWRVLRGWNILEVWVPQIISKYNEPKNPISDRLEFWLKLRWHLQLLAILMLTWHRRTVWGDGWSGDAFGEDVWLASASANAPAQDKSFVTYQGSTTVWKLRKPPGVWSPEAEKDLAAHWFLPPFLVDTASSGKIWIHHTNNITTILADKKDRISLYKFLQPERMFL